jgi:hypothetical protein
VVFLWALLCIAPLIGRAQCLGDFNDDGKVTIDELVTAVDDSLNGCRAGAHRFVDNGDGTVSDLTTGLVWEQKTGTPSGSPVDCSTTTCADPRDVNNWYGWSRTGTPPDGGAFTDFMERLNGRLCTTASCPGLAGHSDWRLPTLSELQTIRDPTQGRCAGGSGPCIDPVFGPTQPYWYWSSSTVADTPLSAWMLEFFDNNSPGDTSQKISGREFVRAVRGGA